MAKMGRPKVEEARTVKITVRLSEKEHERIAEYAAKCDMSVAQVLREGALEKVKEK